MNKSELKKLFGDIRQGSSITINKPNRKSIKQLYAAMRHATVKRESGDLEFSPKFPWDQRLATTMQDLGFFMPSDRSLPLTHRWSSDWLDYFAEFLSDEKVVFLPRVWTSRVVERFVQEYSFVEAWNFVRSNRDHSVQYGWIFHRKDSWIFADFHAAVKLPNGELMLVQQTPGAPFERCVAFVPDNKNKPNFAENSSPALVGLNLFDNSKFHIGTRERVPAGSRIDYECFEFISVDGTSKIVKTGQCPHQPSETMDLIGDIPYETIRRSLKVSA